MTVIALGLASATIVIKFIDDTVFGTIRMGEPFTVAHELVLCYFREMDFDPARLLHMGNVFRRGGQDTLLSEARRNAAAFFRVGGGPSAATWSVRAASPWLPSGRCKLHRTPAS